MRPSPAPAHSSFGRRAALPRPGAPGCRCRAAARQPSPHLQPAERFAPFRCQRRAQPHGRIAIPSVVRGGIPSSRSWPRRTSGADAPNEYVVPEPREMHTGNPTAAAHLPHQPGASCQPQLPSTVAPPPSSPRAPSRQPTAARACLHIRRQEHPARRLPVEAREGNTQRAELMIACSRHGFIIRRPGVTQPSEF